MTDACLVCQGSLGPLFEKEDIPYLRCGACGFVCARPARNANFADGLDDYEPAYRQYLEASVEDEPNQAAFLRWVERFLPLRGKRVLDVGAGSGKFVRFLRDQGADASGIEPARPLHDTFLADDPGFFAQTLSEFAQGGHGRFDAVFLCDVIEHVEAPDVLLREASELLAPGGMVFVSTPDVASLLARASGRRWHFFNKYHLSYLSRDTLGRIAGACGLREVGFAHLGRRRSVGYLLQYSLDFVAGGGRLRLPGALRELVVPVNLGDTMTVALAAGLDPTAGAPRAQRT